MAIWTSVAHTRLATVRRYDVKSRLTIRLIIGVSLLLLLAATALYVHLISVGGSSAPTVAASPGNPTVVLVAPARPPEPAPETDRPLAELAVLDFISLEPGGVYDQPWAARQAVEIDPAAPIIVVFNRALTARERRNVAATLTRSLHAVSLQEPEWRGPSEMAIRAAQPLEPGEWYRLDVRPHGGDSAPLASFNFRAREATAICLAAADFDCDGRVDLVAGGPGHPLTFYRHNGMLPAAPGKPCLVAGTIRAMSVCNIDSTPRCELAVVVDAPDGRQLLRVLAYGAGPGGPAWLDVMRPMVLDVAVAGTDTDAAPGGKAGHAHGRAPLSLLAGDFTANGRQDLVLIDPFGRHQFIYTSRSGAMLLMPIEAVCDWHTDMPVTAALVADLDGDSIDDLALAVAGEGVHLLRNDSQQPGRIFREEWSVPDAATIVSLSAADLDRDRWLDLWIGRAGEVDDICLAMGSAEGLLGFRRATPSGLAPPDSLWTRTNLVADLNADQQPDLISAFSEQTGVSVNLNDRSAGFGEPLHIANDGGVTPAGLQLVPGDISDRSGAAVGRTSAAAASDRVARLIGADFDGDGSQDLLAVTNSGRSFYLLTRLNVFRPGPEVLGTVTFEEGIGLLPEASGQVACAVAGDVNRDGWLDLAVGLVAGGAEIWLGSEGGRYTRDEFITELRGRCLILVDADDDGDLDLLDVDTDPDGATRDAGVAVILVSWNGGMRASPDSDIVDAGHFGAGVAFITHPVHECPTAVAVADFNGDGEVDVFLGGASGSMMLIGHGPDAFVDMPLPQRLRATRNEANSPPPVSSAIASDFDNDGLIDVMLGTRARADGREASPMWLRNIGDGQFEAVPLPRSRGTSIGLAAGDLDANAALDLLWLDPDTRQLEIRLGRTDESASGPRWKREAIPLDSLFETVTGLSLLDLDGDGTPEPVITGRQTGEGWQEVWRSDGYGTLLYARSEGVALRALSAGLELRPLLVADLSGNARPDMLTVDEHGKLHLYLTRLQ